MLETENGFKFGAGRLHPFFDLEFRYDSAAGFFPENDVPTAPEVLQPEIIAHFRPGLNFSVPGANTDVSLSGYLDYVWYTGWLTPGANKASRLEGQADFVSRFNRQGVVGLELTDHFARTDRTENPAVGVGVISLFNIVGAQIPLRPGGGALELSPGAQWSLEYFEPQSFVAPPGCNGNPICDPVLVDQMDYQNVHFDLDGKWRFLPKTALLLDTGLDLQGYPNGSANPTAQVLQIAGGLSGLISPKLALLAKAGWGQDMGASGVSTVVAHLELSYLWSETRNIKVGYLRQFSPVPAYGTYTDDRPYVEAKFFFAGRFTLRTGAMYDYMSFYSGSGRHDSQITLMVVPEVQVTKWLIATLGYNLTSRGSTLTTESLNFNRNEVFARLSFTY